LATAKLGAERDLWETHIQANTRYAYFCVRRRAGATSEMKRSDAAKASGV